MLFWCLAVSVFPLLVIGGCVTFLPHSISFFSSFAFCSATFFFFLSLSLFLSVSLYRAILLQQQQQHHHHHYHHLHHQHFSQPRLVPGQERRKKDFAT